jgi:N-acetylglutamate synthase-like GNAT family acetyltransferase
MHKSAVTHLLQLLPLTQHGNKMLHCCQYITFREIHLQPEGGVIFFRRVPHTASDEGGWIIEGIGVRTELRGKGIGTALVRQTIATVLQECAQAGSPRIYISTEQNARWWLLRLGFARADPKWNLNRRKGTFVMVWRPTQRDLCAPHAAAEIQWGWQP